MPADDWLRGGGDGNLPIGQNGNTGNTGNTGSTGSTDITDITDISTSTDTSNRSYVPLLVFEGFDDFSGLGKDDIFRSDGYPPFVEVFVVNPVDATTLVSIDNAGASDYEVTVDDIEISELESFPRLQKVLGSSTSLKTALVFDVSGSAADVAVDALVAEAKAYIAAAQASSDEMVSKQSYTVWAFGERIEELTTDFTSNTAAIEAALDLVATRFDNPATLGVTTNLHRAIVQSIGRYVNLASTPAYNFRTDGTNDLQDRTTRDLIDLTQLVLFSSGLPTFLEMDQSLMTRAIQSQSFISYGEGSSASDEAVSLYKPVFYYVVGGSSVGVTYQPLSDLSEVTTQLVLSAGTYSFSADLVQDQINAINRRIDLDNIYIYSYAFAPRIGDHTRLFSSKSDNFNYTLTGDYSAADLAAGNTGTPAEVLPVTPLIGPPPSLLQISPSLVEITGPNGEYLATQTASLAEVATFAPSTRWVNGTFGTGDYIWVRTGGAGTANADGTYTVTTAPATLQLTNNALMPAHTTTIEVTN